RNSPARSPPTRPATTWSPRWRRPSAAEAGGAPRRPPGAGRFLRRPWPSCHEPVSVGAIGRQGDGRLARPRSSELRPGTLAALMNLPALVCLAVVLVYPIAYAGYLSVHEVTLRQLRTGDFPWAGAANFTRLIGDEVFWLSLSHTAVFAAVSVGLEVL